MMNPPHPNKLLKCPLLTLILVVLVALVAGGCQPRAERPAKGPPLKLTLAVRSAPYSGLIAIADEKGYFKEAGLEVSVKLYPSGKAALEAVGSGQAQVATVADIAFAAKALEEPTIRVLASIATTVGDQIVARRDKNIQNPDDLRGKRVGIVSNTTSDYFLYTFLIIENIPHNDVMMIDIPASQQAEALVRGDVDAVSAFEIFAFEAKKRLGGNAVYWDSQYNLAYHWLLAADQSLTENPEPLRRLLRALIRAEDFAQANELETWRIVSQKWGFDLGYLQESRTRLDVSFGQSIVTSLQSYTLWHLRHADHPEEPLDVLNFLHTGTLDEVAPELVTIFR
jgi:ABC-type nitrate/sulfonate/bicarbonate transport system substrate-binding protein